MLLLLFYYYSYQCTCHFLRYESSIPMCVKWKPILMAPPLIHDCNTSVCMFNLTLNNKKTWFQVECACCKSWFKMNMSPTTTSTFQMYCLWMFWLVLLISNWLPVNVTISQVYSSLSELDIRSLKSCNSWLSLAVNSLHRLQLCKIR